MSGAFTLIDAGETRELSEEETLALLYESDRSLKPDVDELAALIDAGHYETERITERLLVDWIAERFPELSIRSTEHRTSPMQTFVGTAGR